MWKHGFMSDSVLPDEATLAKYMHLMQAALLAIRASPDREAADLAYAIHNLPDLLMRWPELDEKEQAGAMRRFEAQHPRWAGHFTGILKGGAPTRWQLKWTRRAD